MLPTSLDLARLPRSARMRARAEFDRAFAEGRRFSDRRLGLHWLATAQPPRLGLAVSRKVDPRAVGRNRIKRALREEFRRLRVDLQGGDYVLVARAEAASSTPRQLRDALQELLQRAGALPRPAAPGTMPPAPPNVEEMPADPAG